jgi:membrane protease YdiL (CAAX protease family)
MLILTIFLELVLFGFFILLLIACVRRWRLIKLYVRHGLVLAGLLILIDAIALLLLPRFPQPLALVIMVIVNIITFFKIIIFVCAGRYYCCVLEIDDMPLLDRFFVSSRGFARFNVPRYLFAVLVVAAGGIVFSLALFSAVKPHISEFLVKLTADQGVKTKTLVANEPSWLVTLAFLEFALAEEIIFRLGIQNWLAKVFRLSGRKYWVAVVITALLWTIGHGHVLDPAWAKLLQIFPMGIALGFLFKNYGIEACVLSHGIFNIVLMFWGPVLIAQ